VYRVVRLTATARSHMPLPAKVVVGGSKFLEINHDPPESFLHFRVIHFIYCGKSSDDRSVSQSVNPGLEGFNGVRNRFLEIGETALLVEGSRESGTVKARRVGRQQFVAIQFFTVKDEERKIRNAFWENNSFAKSEDKGRRVSSEPLLELRAPSILEVYSLYDDFGHSRDPKFKPDRHFGRRPTRDKLIGRGKSPVAIDRRPLGPSRGPGPLAIN